MDPFTHTLLGGVFADTGLRRRSALATPTLLIGVNAPDIDVFSYVRGADTALHFRRGWTHGLLALVVLPVVLTLIMVAFDRWRRRRAYEGPPVRPRQLLFLAAIAVASHPLLDWLNTYGVRVLMPFDGRWFYGDALFIVDPWIWLLFGGVLFLNHSAGGRHLVRWGTVASGVTIFFFLGAAGPHRWAPWLWTAGVTALAAVRCRRVATADGARRRLARLGLAAGALYVGLMIVLTAWASGEVRGELEAAGVEPAGAFMVGPDRLDPFVRLVVVPTGDAYRFGRYHLLRRPRLRLDDTAVPMLSPDELPGIAPPDVVAAARGAPCVRGMVVWMRHPFYEVDVIDDGYLVYILDARYVRRRTVGFGSASVAVGRDLAPRCQPLQE